MNGGPGADEITIGGIGSDGVNTVDAGSGDDTIDVGRAGQADAVTGGPGTDTVTYAGHSAVTVTLDGSRNDGTGAEGDDVRPDVEHRHRHGGGDTLIGERRPRHPRRRGRHGPPRGPRRRRHPDRRPGGRTTRPSAARATTPSCCATGSRTPAPAVAPAPTPSTSTSPISRHLRHRVLVPARCIFPRLVLLPFTPIANIGALNEGPNVRMAAPAPAVRAAGVRTRLTCPAVLRAPCAGALRVFAGRATRALGTAAYSIAHGRSKVVLVPLDAAAREAALAARALRIVSVERGRSRLGPKTTIRWCPPAGGDARDP